MLNYHLMKQLAVDIGKQFWIRPGQGIESQAQFQSIGNLISAILPNVYVIASLILLIFLIFGGITVIVGAGKGNAEQAEKGKKILTNTLIGFLVIFAGYWIMQILGIITGLPIL